MTTSSKVRLYDLAKELKLDTGHLISEVRQQGVSVSVASNSISKELAQRLRSKYLPKHKSAGTRVVKLEERPAERPDSRSASIKKSNDECTKDRIKHCQVCNSEWKSESRLNRHLLKAHSDDVLAGSVLCYLRVYEVCRELGTDKKKIAKAARQIGHEIGKGSSEVPPEALREILKSLAAGNGSPGQEDHPLDEETILKLKLKGFTELRELIIQCLRGGRVPKNDQPLITTNQRRLSEYVQILESKIHIEGVRYEIDFDRKTLIRLTEDSGPISLQAILPGAKRVKWKLLPLGPHPFSRIEKHFERLSKSRPGIQYDLDRLYKINGLNPDETYVGIDEFKGYVVFYFKRVKAAILDCPIKGNAIYVFGSNWESLCRLTKYQLLNHHSRNVFRIIHRKEWFSEVRSLLSTIEQRTRLLSRQK